MTEPKPTCQRCGSAVSPHHAGGNCPSCLYASVMSAPECDEAPGDPPTEGAGGEEDFEILEEIGRGGAGVVYRARQKSVGRIVALKTLHGSSILHPDAFERFRIEADAVGRLEHPHVVSLYGIGQFQGTPFLAFRYFGRGSLADALRHRRFSPRESATLIATAARAIHFAHQHGVLHRDLKPSNLLLDDDDEPHVADFGLAKLEDSTSGLTLSNAVLGTPAYMAPEQARGGASAMGTPADIYALGAVLFELLTGRPPFIGATPLEVVRLVTDSDPPRPRSLNPDLDRDLETICLHCLERDPDHRYSSAAALASDLESWLRHEPLGIRPPTGRERILKWARRRPLVAALSAGIVMAFLSGVGATLWQWREAVAARETSLFENYASTLKVVSQALTEGRLSEARSRLLAQPERFRGWEWGRLMHQAHPEVFSASIPSHSNAPSRFTDQIHHHLSPDGSLIAASRPDHPMQIYKPREPAWEKVLGSLNEPVSSGVFSSDGLCLATAGPGPGFTLWDTRTWNPVLRFETNTHPRRQIDLQPGGGLMATCAPGEPVRIWDRSTGVLRGELAVPGMTPGGEVHFSRDGQRILRPRAEQQTGSLLAVWEADTLRRVGVFPRNPERYVLANLSPDARRMATVDTNGVAEAWVLGAETPYFRAAGEGPNSVWSVHLSEHPDRLAVLREPGLLRFWDTAKQRLLASPSGRVTQLNDVSKEWFVTRNGDRFVRVFDWDTGSEVHRLASDTVNSGQEACLSSDRRLLTATAADAMGVRTLHAWTLPSQDRRFNDPPSPISGKLSPDGRLAALGHFGSQLTLWDVESGRRIGFLQGHWRWVDNVAWSPDGRRLYSASVDHTVRIWNIPEGTLEQTLHHHTEPVFRLALSRDGRRLASADMGGRIQMCELPGGRVISSWVAQTNNWTWNLSFSPDGRFLAAPGYQTQGGVWEAETGRQILRFADRRNTPQNDTIAATFRPDGTELATLDMNGRIRFWDTARWSVLRTAEAIGAAMEMQYSADGSRLLIQVTDNSVSDAGTSSLCVHEGRSGQLITTLGNTVASGSELSFSDATGCLLQTLASSENSGYGASYWEAFPWRHILGKTAENSELEFYSDLARTRHWDRFDRSAKAPANVVGSPWIEPRTNWPARLPGTPDRCLDLTQFYNGHLDTGWQPIMILNYAQDDLGGLPQGNVVLDGVPWDIRGVITLGRPESQPQLIWPAGDRVGGVPVGRACRRLHFLHALSHYSGEETTVGRYRLNFEDGTFHDLELRPTRDIGEWWTSNAASRADDGTVAWEGDSVIAAQFNSRLRLFHRAWDNPHPDKKILSFDFLSDHTPCVPFLVAVTLEP